MSTNHMNNLFTNGVNVSGGLITDSLVVNGVSISSGGGSGVSIATNINDNSATNVPCTQITYSLNQKNTAQDNTLNSHDSTLTSHTTSIATLNTAMDALYGGTALGWVGVTGASFLINSGAMPKTGGTFTGDVAHGTNNITSVKDVKFSNALIGTNTSNIYCGNVICTSNLYGVGTNLDLTKATNFGTTPGVSVNIGNTGGFCYLPGYIQGLVMASGTDIVSGRDYTCTRDLVSSNALMTANVYCSNVIVPTGAFYYGNGSKLTGLTASTDCTSVLNYATVPTTGALSVGTAMTSGTVKIGNTTASGPQVIINGGANGLSLSGGSTGLTVNSNGPISIGNSTDTAISLGFTGGTNPVNIKGASLNATIPHVINTSATHTPLSTGLIQTCVIPLSSEQGPISVTSGAGVLPTVMFRVPFQWKIYGTRAHCLSASTSGSVIIDIRSFPQSTAIGPSTVNSTLGTSIFQASPKLGIAASNYSSVGSGISSNGLLVTTPAAVADDSMLGVFITSAGTNVLGLKLIIYYTL